MVVHRICYSHKFLKYPKSAEKALHAVRRLNHEIPVECIIHCTNYEFSPFLPHTWTFIWEAPDGISDTGTV